MGERRHRVAAPAAVLSTMLLLSVSPSASAAGVKFGSNPGGDASPAGYTEE